MTVRALVGLGWPVFDGSQAEADGCWMGRVHTEGPKHRLFLGDKTQCER